jgi:hypothetical protein
VCVVMRAYPLPYASPGCAPMPDILYAHEHQSIHANTSNIYTRALLDNTEHYTETDLSHLATHI